MAYRDILVHVDNSKASPARLEAAIGLAKSLEARLTGLYVFSKPYLPAYTEIQINPDILEAQTEEIKKMAEKTGEAFAAATKGMDAEWRTFEGLAAEALALHARYADLTIVGQGNPDDSLFLGDRDMPDRLILTSSRPSLVVPYVGDYKTIGENVMIAWDAGPQASRAVHDALPVLKRAKQVTVMEINPKNGNGGTGDIPGADIAQHLSRHGVNAETDHIVTNMKPGDMLLSRAADRGTDLIVMGAYGHARWAELVLGGVTNYMLGHMTVPVLMSH